MADSQTEIGVQSKISTAVIEYGILTRHSVCNR